MKFRCAFIALRLLPMEVSFSINDLPCQHFYGMGSEY
jgi:hypothetical protein